MLKHKGTQTLYTNRLVLRKYNSTDADYMYKNYATDEQVTKFLNWKPYKKVEDIELFLQEVISQYSHTDVYHWAIEIDGEMIGSISTMTIDEENCSCEIGYCIGRAYWNKGIMSEAVSAVIEFLFDEVSMKKIIAKHDIENPASGKVMKKCNMSYEETKQQYYLRHDGTVSDAVVYSISRNK